MKVALQPPGLPRAFELELHARRDLLSEAILRNRVWEPFETRLVIEQLRAGQTFVDVGANIGYYTLIASMIVGPDGRVVAIEPDPGNFALLESNCRAGACANVVLHNVALADCDEERPLYLSPDNLGDHRLADEEGRATTPVRAVRGDGLLEHDVACVDFLKIDTQGSESLVVEGLAGLIRASRASLRMIIEYWPYALARSGGSARALIESLAQADLQFQVIDHIGHRLLPSTAGELIDMAEEGVLRPATRGFINLYLSPAAS